MPLVHALSNSRVYVHARGEHPPPHFHLVGPGWDASVDIETLVVVKGWAPRSDLAEAIGWAADNRKLLFAKWSEYNERDD
jgi:hypothetical protein